jgi:hypothetical protein
MGEPLPALALSPLAYCQDMFRRRMLWRMTLHRVTCPAPGSTNTVLRTQALLKCFYDTTGSEGEGATAACTQSRRRETQHAIRTSRNAVHSIPRTCPLNAGWSRAAGFYRGIGVKLMQVRGQQQARRCL